MALRRSVESKLFCSIDFFVVKLNLQSDLTIIGKPHQGDASDGQKYDCYIIADNFFNIYNVFFVEVNEIKK